MTRHLKYLRYLIRHKWFVFQAGLKTGAPFWRLLVHDRSKFLPSEWFPYANYFYGGNPTDETRTAFDRAWLLHQNRNSHHWQYHVLIQDDGEITPLEMPDADVREMVADWAGAGRAITGKWEAGTWYLKNRNRMSLHPKTRGKVEYMLLGYNAPPGEETSP